MYVQRFCMLLAVLGMSQVSLVENLGLDNGRGPGLGDLPTPNLPLPDLAVPDLPQPGLPLQEQIERFLKPFLDNLNDQTFTILDDSPPFEVVTDAYVAIVTQAPIPDGLVDVTFKIAQKKESVVVEATKESLDEGGFDPSLQTVLVIPGKYASLSLTMAFINQNQRLKKNALIADFGNFAQDSDFKTSVKTILVGLRAAKFLKEVMKVTGIKAETISLLGYDVGAHAAGYVGKSIPNIRQITALDAAGPIWQFIPRNARLTYTDATFVEALHTNGALFQREGKGYLRALAHQDFFANGGTNQPPCSDLDAFKGSKDFEYLQTDVENDGGNCDHTISITYYLLSLYKKPQCQIKASLCNSYDDFKYGRCSEAPTETFGGRDSTGEVTTSPYLPRSKFYYNYTQFVSPTIC